MYIFCILSVIFFTTTPLPLDIPLLYEKGIVIYTMSILQCTL